jgi:KUP system potassium uptake protein
METRTNEYSRKGAMWELERNLDQPMDAEAGRLRNMYREKTYPTILLLRLAFQSLGVVFGDLGTSPLYVFYNIFPHGIEDTEQVIGALSLIIYSLTLIPLVKYVFIVLRANDNGQGKSMFCFLESFFFLSYYLLKTQNCTYVMRLILLW